MAKDKKEVTEEAEKPVEPTKKSKLKWIIVVSVLLVVVSAAAAAGVYFFTKTETKKPVAEKPVVLTIWPMDAFVINIAETNGERYLKIVMQLEVTDSAAVAELDQSKARLRDSILDLLTSKAYKELVDVAGKQRLREDIAGRINNILQKGKVNKVYITEFVIQ
jgi:flagellar FliL protein